MKTSKRRRIIAQCLVLSKKQKCCQGKQKSAEKQKWNFSSSALFYMRTRVGLKYFVNDCRLAMWAIKNLNLKES